MSQQLELDVPGWPTLTVVPTAAMKDGRQVVFQCAQCATVIVRSGLASTGDLGTCPACKHPSAAWWKQSLPIAGLEQRGAR